MGPGFFFFLFSKYLWKLRNHWEERELTSTRPLYNSAWESIIYSRLFMQAILISFSVYVI